MLIWKLGYHSQELGLLSWNLSDHKFVELKIKTIHLEKLNIWKRIVSLILLKQITFPVSNSHSTMPKLKTSALWSYGSCSITLYASNTKGTYVSEIWCNNQMHKKNSALIMWFIKPSYSVQQHQPLEPSSGKFQFLQSSHQSDLAL